MKRIAIVGGGIAGLTAAYALCGKAHVTVVDPGPLGGTIRTVREKGFLIEGGPDSFVVVKPEGTQLCKELGLEKELAPSVARKVYVYSDDKLHELPEGIFLTVPTKILPMARSRLISWPGKLRMALDLFMPTGGGKDESLGSFVRRRFGREALAKIAEPLMGGIFVADADRLSLQATFPRFLEMERKHRSLIRALRSVPMSGKSPFLTLRSGMDMMVERLISRTDATFVRAEARAIEPGLRVVLSDGDLRADAVIVATPAPVAARLLGRWPNLSAAIAKIPYVSTATVSLGFRAEPLDGSGFVIPRAERRGIFACTWSSSKFEGRAPEGHVLLRCFLVGEPRDPLSLALREVRDILGIEAEPVVAKCFSWPAANPIYEVGHQKRLEEIDARLPTGIFLTGAGYRGVGIPGCIGDARAVAADLLRKIAV